MSCSGGAGGGGGRGGEGEEEEEEGEGAEERVRYYCPHCLSQLIRVPPLDEEEDDVEKDSK
jgi:hypothetical protein